MATVAKLSLGILTTLVLAASMAGAHPRTYQAASGDVLGICFIDGGTLTDVPSSGGTCWEGNHITPDLSGLATVTISDSALSPVGGFVCQDVNLDVACGGAGELSQAMCGSSTISTGALWDPTVRLWAFVNGPVNGALDAAGLTGQCNAASPGSVGTVGHS